MVQVFDVALGRGKRLVAELRDLSAGQGREGLPVLAAQATNLDGVDRDGEG